MIALSLGEFVGQKEGSSILVSVVSFVFKYTCKICVKPV